MKSSKLSNGENRIALRQLLQNRKLRHLWRHNLGSRWKLQKMARDNFSIGAFYNITKNQDNSIKTVEQDSFLSPKTPQKYKFLGSPSPQGSHSPYILGDTTRHITCPSLIEIGSKAAEKNSAQTNKQTDTTKIMVTWPWTNIRILLLEMRDSKRVNCQNVQLQSYNNTILQTMFILIHELKLKNLKSIVA